MDVAAALIAENESFAEVLRSADPATEVPTCPGWTFKHLLRHVGRGHWWAAQIVDDRLDGYLDPRDVRNGKPPDDADGAVDWLLGGARGLVEAVDRIGGETPVWTFLGMRPAAWWARRRLHEVAVHRADAELALGGDFRLPADVAADGLTEWLERVVVQADSEHMPVAAGQALHLHAGDGGEWTLRSDGTVLTLDRSDVDADATVSGDATSLLLAVVRRLPADDPRLSVSGDDAVWRGWLERTPF